MIPQGVEYIRFLPEIILSLAGVFIMFYEAVTPAPGKKFIAGFAFVALVAALGGSILAYQNAGMAFNNMLIVDGFATFFRVLVIGVGMLTILSSTNYLRLERPNAGEYYTLLLFCI